MTHFKGLFHCLSYRHAEAEAFTEQHKPGSMSATSSNVPISVTRSPMAPTPAVPVSFALFDPEHFRVVSPQKPQLGSGNLGESLLLVIIRDFERIRGCVY